MKKQLALIALCVAFSTAVSAQGTLDPAVEARLTRIATELRCLVCQNQSIADSHADLAVDLREQIREQIAAGRSDDEIRAYMVERYGDFVLYRPPVKRSTWLLWGAPLILLLAGALLLARHVRGRSRASEAPPLSAEDRARAAALLEGKSPE